MFGLSWQTRPMLVVAMRGSQALRTECLLTIPQNLCIKKWLHTVQP